MSKILIATAEPIGETMAGPAIRASHIARVAAECGHSVTLVSLGGATVAFDGPSRSRVETNPIFDSPVQGIEALDDDYDAALLHGRLSLEAKALISSSTPIAFDWFDPFHLEALERSRDDTIRRRDLVEGAHKTLLGQASRGDFFVCSNRAQRAHWLGWLAAAGRCNPATYDADPTLRQLIDEAGFGTGVTGPGHPHDQPCPIRSEFSVIGPDDPIVVWAGGLHDWLDPVSAVESMPIVLEKIPQARLVFLAGPHPNTSLEQMGARGEAIERARRLGLFGTHVLFITKWVPYLERISYLKHARVGLVMSKPSIEAQLSHRTRLLDHLEAGLPTVTTRGEPLGDAFIAAGAAAGVKVGDAASLGSRLSSLLANADELGRLSHRATALSELYRWEQTLLPLMRWFDDPRPAPDRDAGMILNPNEVSGVTRLIERARMHSADGGVQQVVERSVSSAKRQLRQRRS